MFDTRMTEGLSEKAKASLLRVMEFPGMSIMSSMRCLCSTD